MNREEKSALALGISLILTTITIFGVVVYGVYKFFSVLNKISHALDLYIDEHDYAEEVTDPNLYDESDDDYISCNCCAIDPEDE